VRSSFRRLAALLVSVAIPAFLATCLPHGSSADIPKPPSLEPILGKGADSAWTRVAGTFAVGPDKGLGKPVLSAEKAQVILEDKGNGPAARELRALVRLRTDTAPAASADFTVGRKDAKAPGLRMVLSTTKAAGYIACQVFQDGKALHDVAAISKKLDWDATPGNGFTYYPRAYSLRDVRPGWPEDFRLRIEHDMAALPDVNDKWLSIRIQARAGEVLFWLDDRLVGIKKGPDVNVQGLTHVELSPGVQLASMAISPWEPAKGFVELPLGGYTNAREFAGGSAVKPESLPLGKPLVLAGVPFTFPGIGADGNDHIDVGRSLYRHASLEGYFPSSDVRWIGSTRRDPARIQLRIPNGQYDRLFLIAASDDKPDMVPVVTALFYRPSAGFAESFEARVPLFNATAAGSTRVPVTLANGRQASLWRVEIPLDPGRLASFADMDIVEVELTKKVRLFRSYPDPFIYGWHQAGRPSAVHVFAATLRESDVGFDFTPEKFGHVWTAPEIPAYTATIANRSSSARTGSLTVLTRSHDGTEQARQVKAIALAPGATQAVKVSVPVKLNGHHDITATLTIERKPDPIVWLEKRSFVRLAPDTRAPRWTEGKGALFGYWSYHGGHYTPKADHHIRLMTEAGARTSIGLVNKDNPFVKKHWTRVPAGAWEVAPQPWAAEDPIDPKKYAAYQQEVVKVYTAARNAVPPEYRPDHVLFFPEPHVSQRLTEGNFPTYWGAPEYVMTTEEKKNLRIFLTTARCAAEAIRQKFPELKVLIPWGDALFAVPLLRAGFPKNLIDGSGIDTPGFERLPEMQLHHIAVHRLYELKKEYAKAGIPNPRLQYCEGIFVPTEPGSVSYREQMDLYNRWTLLSMAYGVTRFYSGWFAFDCGNYYGSEHYGGCGIQRRIPYCDPKPAYAAYATMTDKLDQANFDGWLKTGSLTTYCLRFKGPKGLVYALWTLRGKRPVTLTTNAPANVQITDAMNNTRAAPTENKQVSFTTDASVIYVTGAEVASVKVGAADNTDVQPAKNAKLVSDLGDGTWSYSNKRDKLYENGHFSVQRFPGKFTARVIEEKAQGNVLASILEKQAQVHELMPWYNILTPKKPIVLAGAPSHLGMWVHGTSDWGRVIYTLRDAKGERWTSIGTQDQYNCDDVHSWSAFNFDGWRCVRFELPGHTGFDSFRKHGTTWWRSDGGDGIVDLPLTLENIIVEQRTHVLYVNDVQPVASSEVRFGKLYAEYAAPADANAETVRVSKLRMPLPEGAVDLPNPIVEVQRDGLLAATAITKLVLPLEHNDGTFVHVHFKEMPDAKLYFVWCSAHADGRGAVNLTPGGTKTGGLVYGLRPALKLHFWVTYQDAKGKVSKPSPAASAVLVDNFKEK
jgi:hypothetical protein